MKKVIIESPFAGDQEANERYLNECLRDSLDRGEAPFASHGLYTRPGVLDDSSYRERIKGIKAGFAWRELADLTAFYIDLGISQGMADGVLDVIRKGRPLEFRSIVSDRALEDSALDIVQALRNANVKKVI